MFDTFDIRTEPTVVTDASRLVRRAHTTVLTDREARNIARDLAAALLDGLDVTLVTNSDAKRILVRRHDVTDYPTVCPRCADRGRERFVGHPHDWQVCHVPFVKPAANLGDRSPLEWLALGCHTCNREDPDWAVAH